MGSAPSTRVHSNTHVTVVRGRLVATTHVPFNVVAGTVDTGNSPGCPNCRVQSQAHRGGCHHPQPQSTFVPGMVHPGAQPLQPPMYIQSDLPPPYIEQPLVHYVPTDPTPQSSIPFVPPAASNYMGQEATSGTSSQHLNGYNDAFPPINGAPPASVADSVNNAFPQKNGPPPDFVAGSVGPGTSAMTPSGESTLRGLSTGRNANSNEKETIPELYDV
ncbi:hypothetical protein MAR_011232 [Mya arenaria]|uniref:Uncharacterized protein n=1 Tax=Mya arenaria TaxID=6604 RepID=A0ABY7FTH6_MYAAR|nr:uncharacterized protein LOC128215794 [Mya arenaria]XP_052778354.1 uncharacterized protein LOC128215794 [Mya arenaria]WAR25528.1 hypothetical protein MAR_011232 [Mya arenaria]